MKEQIHELVGTFAAQIGEQLGDGIVGIYLTGSSVSGEFRADMSDIDVFVVLHEEPTPQDLIALEDVHARLLGDHPWDHKLEVEYLVRDRLRPFGVDGGSVSWTPSRGLTTGSNRMASDDVLGLHRFGEAIVGPAAGQIFPRVDADLFRAETAQYLDDLLTRPQTRPGSDGEAFADWIANISRCLFRLATGELGTKRAACSWWCKRDPAMCQILTLVEPARRGDFEAAAACIAHFPTVVRHAQRLRDELLDS